VSTFVYAQAALAWLPISCYGAPVDAAGAAGASGRAEGASGGAAGASGRAAGAAIRTDTFPAALPTSRPFISFQGRKGLAMLYVLYSVLLDGILNTFCHSIR
jgi:hypothetical protein